MTTTQQNMTINRNNIRTEWENAKRLIEAGNQKLSPNRAGELAAAKIKNIIERDLADIDNRVRRGNITDDEAAWYDDIYVNGWHPSQELIALSGSRTLLLDLDAAESQ